MLSNSYTIVTVSHYNILLILSYQSQYRWKFSDAHVACEILHKEGKIDTITCHKYLRINNSKGTIP